MAITQKQIAEALGVSHQLVSFVLNGGGTVSQRRRREILEAAHRMGYRRNELARDGDGQEPHPRAPDL
jgi:DNA-binding LacI/PurR family transcriptional regulator